MVQNIEIRTPDLSAFKRIAYSYEISYTLQQCSFNKWHSGIIKGEQIKMLKFAQACGDLNIPVTFY
ncbi:hypothetical protein [Flavobacterium microcysteis]|uniref:Uncharacterized protein n=1 Tax=Flavobacterium microcysteis TaxID=2596891 RepID=A0A501QC52_9FLAO|nr:hypothetical protein [Flavobacterium microcysteis]TPD70510.1 hypothetical protein FJA49_06120 [Flavobacterium microcysteis]